MKGKKYKRGCGGRTISSDFALAGSDRRLPYIFTKIRLRYSSHISAQQNSTVTMANSSEAFAGLANFKNWAFKYCCQVITLPSAARAWP